MTDATALPSVTGELAGRHLLLGVTGGVAEYFPGVLIAIAQRLNVQIAAVPQPILAGALGAALWVFDDRRLFVRIQGVER